jgi:hypothetical protein
MIRIKLWSVACVAGGVMAVVQSWGAPNAPALLHLLR